MKGEGTTLSEVGRDQQEGRTNNGDTEGER